MTKDEEFEYRERLSALLSEMDDALFWLTRAEQQVKAVETQRAKAIETLRMYHQRIKEAKRELKEAQDEFQKSLDAVDRFYEETEYLFKKEVSRG